jgi:AraC family transcriptional regulator
MGVSAFDEHFQRSPLAEHRHERRGGGALSTRLIRLESPAHQAIDPPTDELVVGLVLEGSAGARWSWDGARPNVARSRRPGALGLTPISAAGEFEVDGASTLLIVTLPHRTLSERLAPDLAVPRDFGRLHDAYRDHPAARALCLRLWRTAGRPGFARDEAIDALAEDLLVVLSKAREPEVSKGLSAAEQRRVRSAAEGGRADVAGLAQAASMPVRTFRRRFQVEFGEPPQRWLARTRIERASRLLSEGLLSLSETALDLGFANQAHFTETYRRATGTTPGRYRREKKCC